METKNEIKTEELIRDGVKEVIIREGEALKLHEPRTVDVSGTIGSPAEYLVKRKSEINAFKSHVLFSYAGMYIVFNVNEDSHYQTTIKGKTAINPDLQKFGINNGNKTWTKNELKQFLKMNRAFFKDIDSNMKIVTNLEKFSASVQTQIDDHKDDRGNKKNNTEIKVDSNLDLNFVLEMPIFTGQPKSKFQVEICFDVRDNAITIWLESPELQESILKQTVELIDANVAPFREKFVVIEQ